ncbi:unnamed protein product [Sphagnum jensenii]|uniref:Uncharacterized protein n=1 Tax=Sphagnum jensenii TaxID=128206 RepID=A0ABP0V5L6_9BRYO
MNTVYKLKAVTGLALLLSPVIMSQGAFAGNGDQLNANLFSIGVMGNAGTNAGIGGQAELVGRSGVDSIETSIGGYSGGGGKVDRKGRRRHELDQRRPDRQQWPNRHLLRHEHAVEGTPLRFHVDPLGAGVAHLSQDGNTRFVGVINPWSYELQPIWLAEILLHFIFA